jgi:lactonase
MANRFRLSSYDAVRVISHSILAAALFVGLATVANAQQSAAIPVLAYDDQTRGPVPIPPSERNLQTVVAEPWFKVSDEGIVLEGPSFERDGNFVFSDVYGGRVLRLSPDKRLSTVYTEKQLD